MIVKIQKHKHDFVIIDRRCAQDERLSWKARGLLFYLLSKPDDWQIKVADLVKQAPNGRDAVYSALKELREHGYIVIENLRNDVGKIAGKKYIVYEVPQKVCNLAIEDTSPSEKKEKKTANNEDQASQVIQYLNEKAGRNFETQGRRAQANLRLVKARMREGTTLAELKSVIDHKVMQWKGTEMEHYLRPSTLFRPSKFYEYLEASKTETKAKTTDNTKLDRQSELLYSQAEQRFRAAFPELYDRFGYITRAEWLDFNSSRPKAFPMLHEKFSRNYLKSETERILRELQSAGNTYDLVKQHGGLYRYLVNELLKVAK